jgi:hypothetical protein
MMLSDKLGLDTLIDHQVKDLDISCGLVTLEGVSDLGNLILHDRFHLLIADSISHDDYLTGVSILICLVVSVQPIEFC